MFDIIIKNGTIVDGSGSPRVKADLGIKQEKIEAIGDLSNAQGSSIVDATGLVVSPGFIDTHAHSDGVLLTDPQHASGVRQGITTEILGQDGLSYAPLNHENYLMYRQYLSGLLGMPPPDLDMSSVTAFRNNYHKKCAVNTAYCVAHGAIRIETVGFNDVPLVGKDLENAKALVRDSIEQGAVALATGMSYYPNSWSTTEELIQLCSAADKAGGLYVTHLRDVNTERGFEGGGVEEALEIGRKSGVKVHFSHFRTTPEDFGIMSAKEKISLIDKSKSEVDSTLELYPYPVGSSFAIMTLDSISQDGGTDAIIDRLNNPVKRKIVAKLIDTYDSRSLDHIVFTHLPNNQDLEGMSVSDISSSTGMTRGQVICDLLVKENLQVGFRSVPPTSGAIWRHLMKDQMYFLSRPDYMLGSDQISLGGFPHPRAYGAFPRFLGRYLRQMPDVMSLETMINRLTLNAADRFGLKKRGLLKEGYFADVVVFNPDTIIDTATFDDPKQFPIGIPHVIVNGKFAVKDESCTGILAGQAVP